MLQAERTQVKMLRAYRVALTELKRESFGEHARYTEIIAFSLINLPSGDGWWVEKQNSGGQLEDSNLFMFQAKTTLRCLDMRTLQAMFRNKIDIRKNERA